MMLSDYDIFKSYTIRPSWKTAGPDIWKKQHSIGILKKTRSSGGIIKYPKAMSFR